VDYVYYVNDLAETFFRELNLTDNGRVFIRGLNGFFVDTKGHEFSFNKNMFVCKSFVLLFIRFVVDFLPLILFLYWDPFLYNLAIWGIWVVHYCCCCCIYSRCCNILHPWTSYLISFHNKLSNKIYSYINGISLKNIFQNASVKSHTKNRIQVQ
jgi:hypothetical protein